MHDTLFHYVLNPPWRTSPREHILFSGMYNNVLPESRIFRHLNELT